MILISLVVGAAATIFHMLIHTEKFISSIPEIVAVRSTELLYHQQRGLHRTVFCFFRGYLSQSSH